MVPSPTDLGLVVILEAHPLGLGIRLFADMLGRGAFLNPKPFGLGGITLTALVLGRLGRDRGHEEAACPLAARTV